MSPATACQGSRGVTLLTASPAAGSPTRERVPASLEALGTPTQGFGIQEAGGCPGSYTSASQGADLAMGGTHFKQGFQLTTFRYCGRTWTWAWHLAGKYRTFTAYVGLGSGDTSPATVYFWGPDGKPKAFVADRHTVRSTVLIAGLPTRVAVDVVGDMNFVIRTSTTGAIINFADDALRA